MPLYPCHSERESNNPAAVCVTTPHQGILSRFSPLAEKRIPQT